MECSLSTMAHLPTSIVFLFALFVVAGAQTAIQQQLLSTFIYTLHGDRTPLVLPTSPSLTPLGAEQLFAAGDSFRERYVAPSESNSFTIRGISAYQLEDDQLTVLSTTDQFVAASAQAFLQGLYPPLQTDSNSANTAQNDTTMVAPLRGYQYADIMTVSSNDFNSIWLRGSKSCPAYLASSSDYYETEAFETLQNSTEDFYRSIQPDFLDGILSDASVGYFNAYQIYDYLNYVSIHNTSASGLLAPEVLAKAKILADDLVFALNTDISPSGSSFDDYIRTIAGRTLAARITQAFSATINTQGASDKMTLVFGSYEPVVALAALAGLVVPQHSAFYNVPAPGASYVFELISMQGNDTDAYPEVSDLFVRFLYKNGTGSDSSLVPYPLFGLSPSQTLISFADFVAGLDRFSVSNVQDWCTACNSFSVFCPAFATTNGSLDYTGSGSPYGKRLSPVIGGVIGAVVTLAATALIYGAAMLFGGVRMHRVRDKRRSALGGFKGAEKLASDPDLSVAKGSAGAVVIASQGPAGTGGHERTGSWEMKDQGKAVEAQRQALGAGAPSPRSPSYEDDDMPIEPHAFPVQPRSHV
ncbi:hypothetical protein ABEF92_006258 [Exophiala dermatitidis]